MNTVTLNLPHEKIGLVLRKYREKRGISQTLIAHAAGISTSMLSQIERSVVSASIETLFAVCAALDLEITHLFRMVTEKPVVRVYHQGERLKNSSNGIRYEQLAAHTENAVCAELFLLEVAAHQEAGLSGRGHEGIEMGYVLEGAAILIVDNKNYPLKQGDSVMFNASLPHRLCNTGASLFRAVWNALPPHQDYLELD